ncbi:MAG TPA: multidrug efflux RND transporter permease subunit [Terriglobales bacterium]
MFVDFFIKRPVFATVCSLLIVIAGAISIPTLPIAQFPNLAPPQVTVSSNYTGANSSAVETTVTTILEEAINGAEGMRYMTSSSGSDGSSQITATFGLDRDLDIAAVDVQNRASTVLGRLPREVQQTGLSVTKNSGSFVVAIGFYSPDNRYDKLFISNYLAIYVQDALKRVKGVGNVIIFGERRLALRAWLDPDKLARRGLTPLDVTNAIQSQNLQVAAGALGQEPAPKNQQYQISVRANGRLDDPEQFKHIIVQRTAQGALVELQDVARVELGSETYGSNLSFNGYDALGIGVQQLTNANALEVHDAVLAELKRLEQTFPPGLKYQVAFDTTTAVSDSIRDVLVTLVEAVVIVIIVIFLFLQGWRSTLIPAITIPVSLVGTFAFIKIFGFSINTLTLFGITLATGLVVDDAIVVIENVERHLEEGVAEAHRAAHIAMKEVTGAVIATSIVLIAVFLPVSLFPGTTGLMYKQFALTIAFSIAISAFNSLTLSPSLAGLLLRPREGHRNRFFAAIESVIQRTTHGYVRVLHGLEDHKFWVVVFFIAGLVGAGFLYRAVPTSFVPNEDLNYYIVQVQAPEGASLQYTSDIASRASKMIAEDKNVLGVFSVPGFSFAGSAPNRALIFINLKDVGERKEKENSADAIINRVRPKLMSIPQAFIIPFAPPPIQGLSSFGGFQFELQQTGAGSLSDLQNVMNRFNGATRQRPELAGIFATYSAQTPQFDIVVDREKAQSLGIPFDQISSALQIYVGSQYVNDFDFNNRAYRVFVQADTQFRSQPRDLREFYVRTAGGQMVPLDSLVTVKQSTTASVISHYNIFRAAEIDGSAAPGYSSGQALNAMEQVAQQTLPQGYSYEWTGLALEEKQSGGQSAMLFGLGLLVVYLTLAAQYESFVLPFVILLAVPMAILGALGAQSLRGLENDVYCQVGLVMLIGLASKNAILIVEFAEQLQREGRGLMEAATEAARLRLRPILMTSIAFILGVLPLVFASGAGAAGRHSVGTTVFGGMLVSTVLNLFVIPVLYVIVRTMLPLKTHEELAFEPERETVEAD